MSQREHPPRHTPHRRCAAVTSGTPRTSRSQCPWDPVDCAPSEAPDGHPLLADLPRFHVRGPGEKLFAEAYNWRGR